MIPADAWALGRGAIELVSGRAICKTIFDVNYIEIAI
jgi:hypothetical protein